MKRLLRPAAALCGILLVGSSLAACTVSPPAARVNAETVPMSMVDSVLHSLTATKPGLCYLTAQAQGQVPNVVGAGGAGTYDTAFADDVVDVMVTDRLYPQLAAAKHLAATAASYAQARSDLESNLTSQIQNLSQQGQAVPTFGACLPSPTSTTPSTGAQVLDGLPAAFAREQIHYVEAEELLLADGVDLSPSAVAAYYAANKDQFSTACVSQLTVATAAAANAAIAKLKAGASFASVVASDSIDPAEQAGKGQLGCTLSAAQVAQDLQLPSVTVGQPIGPVGPTTTSSGTIYNVYEVTSEQPQPLVQVEPQIRTALLFASTNQSRVAAEVTAFARRSSISVDPRFGTWKVTQIVPPPAPPSATLLASVGGTQPSPASSAVPGTGPLGAG
ncbi:MAG: hypothetical protein M0007_01860 [Actinomycetota bacterium]|nr:hypothetical protein [Actinomycetota bacterium]